MSRHRKSIGIIWGSSFCRIKRGRTLSGLRKYPPCEKTKKGNAGKSAKTGKKVKEAEEAYQRQAESIVQLQTRLEGESKNLERIRKERNQLNSEYIKENLEELKNSYENLCREEEFLAAEEKKENSFRERTAGGTESTGTGGKMGNRSSRLPKTGRGGTGHALCSGRAEKRKAEVSGKSGIRFRYPEFCGSLSGDPQEKPDSGCAAKKQEKLLARIEQIEIESRETWEQMDRQKENLTEIRFQIQEADLQFTRLSQRLLETAKGLKEEELAAACRQVTASIESLRKQEEQTKESLQTAALAADRLRLEKGKLEAVTEETEKDYILQADILKEN